MITSQHGPRQSQRDELCPAPGEDLRAWVRRVRGTAVLRPDVPAQEEARRDQARQRARRRVRDAARWTAGSLAVLVVFAALHQTAGLSAWFVVASVTAVVATAAATVRASQRTRPAALDAAMPPRMLRQDQVVRLGELDDRRLELFNRGRQALDDLLSSADGHENPSARLADGTIGREQAEWMLAGMLRDLTHVQARYDADPATDPGAAARDELEAAQGSAEAYVLELTEIAVQAEATNLANRRYTGMERARVSGDEGLATAASVRAKAGSALEQLRAYRKVLAELQREFEAKAGENHHPAEGA